MYNTFLFATFFWLLVFLTPKAVHRRSSNSSLLFMVILNLKLQWNFLFCTKHVKRSGLSIAAIIDSYCASTKANSVVPQCSVLSPTPFLVLINDICCTLPLSILTQIIPLFHLVCWLAIPAASLCKRNDAGHAWLLIYLLSPNTVSISSMTHILILSLLYI